MLFRPSGWVGCCSTKNSEEPNFHFVGGPSQKRADEGDHHFGYARGAGTALRSRWLPSLGFVATKMRGGGMAFKKRPMAKLFLGLDSSTQSLSAVVIDHDRRKVVYDQSLNFDATLPQYRTKNGVLPNADPLVKHSPPLLWAEALDFLFAEMKKDGVALGQILAISGSGQQHGSVYLNDRAADALARLGSATSLVSALPGVFSRPTSPIWMDSSTAVECAEIRKNLAVSRLRPRPPARTRSSGSPARKSASFTGPNRKPTPKLPASRWSARSWRRCSREDRAD